MQRPVRELRVGGVPAGRLRVVPRGHVALRGIEILRNLRLRHPVGGPLRRVPVLPVPLAGREVGQVVVDAGGADRIVARYLVRDVLAVDVEPVERRVERRPIACWKLAASVHEVGAVHLEERRRSVGLVEERGALAHVGDRLPVHGRERLHRAVRGAQHRRRDEHVPGERSGGTDQEQRVVQQIRRRRRELRRVRERRRILAGCRPRWASRSRRRCAGTSADTGRCRGSGATRCVGGQPPGSQSGAATTSTRSLPALVALHEKSRPRPSSTSRLMPGNAAPRASIAGASGSPGTPGAWTSISIRISGEK